MCACVHSETQEVTKPLSCSKLLAYLWSFHRNVNICYFSFNPINMATISPSTESMEK